MSPPVVGGVALPSDLACACSAVAATRGPSRGAWLLICTAEESHQGSWGWDTRQPATVVQEADTPVLSITVWDKGRDALLLLVPYTYPLLEPVFLPVPPSHTGQRLTCFNSLVKEPVLGFGQDSPPLSVFPWFLL